MTIEALLFYAIGLAVNAYLLVSDYNHRKGNYSNIASYQISLNLCNIITHAGADLFKQHIWFVLSTSSSFLSVYFLAALVMSAALGTKFQQHLNSKRVIAVYTLVLAGLLLLFGRRDELCKIGSCFSVTLANNEDENAIWKSALAHCFVPVLVILLSSVFVCYRKFFKLVADSQSLISYLKVFAQLCFTYYAVSLFLLCGIFVVEVIFRHYVEDKQISPPNHLCRVICFDEHLFLLLSVFPVYMGYFLKERDETFTAS